MRFDRLRFVLLYSPALARICRRNSVEEENVDVDVIFATGTPEVVKMTTFGTANGENFPQNFLKIKTFPSVGVLLIVFSYFLHCRSVGAPAREPLEPRTSDLPTPHVITEPLPTSLLRTGQGRTDRLQPAHAQSGTRP